MRILLIHNYYKQYGGEDAIFEIEKTLLKDKNHVVRDLTFDNKDIEGLARKLKLITQLFYNTNSARAVEREIKNFKPDVIHVYNFFYLGSPSIFIVAERLKIPVVVTIQNYRLICSGALLMRDSKPCELCVKKTFPLDGIRHRCHRNSRMQTAHLTLVTGIHKLLNTWSRKVTFFIAITEFGRNKLIHSSLNLLPNRVIVKPSSVPLIEISDSIQREDFFVFVGRLSKEKGIETLLKAFQNKSLKLEIIGDGPLRPLVEKAVIGGSNITYSGYRDRAYIISRLRTCKALIFPSVWYECLPVTILEAFSVGTPVIISDIGNLNEIVSHNVNGLYFKTGDPGDLFRTTEEFHVEGLKYMHLYENARKTFNEKYSHERNYKNLIDIYNKAIVEVKRLAVP